MLEVILTIGIPTIGIIALTAGIIKRSKMAIAIGGIIVAICLFIVIAIFMTPIIPG